MHEVIPPSLHHLINLVSLLSGIHCMNGSPLNPFLHVHIATWLIVLHSAFTLQIPGHGSAHFLFIQAKWFGHSLLLTHSGLQLGGVPMKSDKQEQEGDWLFSRQIEFGPQGFGSQALIGVEGGNGRAVTIWSHFSFIILTIIEENVNNILSRKSYVACSIV